MTAFDPKATVKGAAYLVWKNPSLLFWQVGSSMMSAVARGAVLVGIALILAVVVGISVRSGRDLQGVFAFLNRTDFLFGALGLGFSSWLFGFALDAFVWAGTWQTTARHLHKQPVRYLTDAVEQFPRAVWQRLMILLHDGAIIAMFGTTVLATTAAASWLDSGIWATAALWGASLTLYTLLAVLLRLTVSVAAASMFLEGRPWPEAWLHAAQAVVSAPVGYYRAFILSAYALVPAFVIYYLAIFVFNVTVGTAFQPVGELVRLGAEFAMMVGFAAFALLTQVSFFNAYHVQNGERPLPLPIKPMKSESTPPELKDLLPKSVPFRINVDSLELLPLSDAVDRVEDAGQDTETPERSAKDDSQSYDLEAILRSPDADSGEKPSE
ncbi:MAG: hypothetical protein R3E66_12275 [bacterium]